jgi:hypothetical protein
MTISRVNTSKLPAPRTAVFRPSALPLLPRPPLLLLLELDELLLEDELELLEPDEPEDELELDELDELLLEDELELLEPDEPEDELELDELDELLLEDELELLELDEPEDELELDELDELLFEDELELLELDELDELPPAGSIRITVEPAEPSGSLDSTVPSILVPYSSPRVSMLPEASSSTSTSAVRISVTSAGRLEISQSSPSGTAGLLSLRLLPPPMVAARYVRPGGIGSRTLTLEAVPLPGLLVTVRV